MSYRICYDHPDKAGRKGTRVHIRYIAAFILVVAIIFTLCFPTYIQEFRRHALPFLEPDVTQAFEQMLSDIRHGITPQDAAVAFGRKILLEESYIH